MPSEINTKFTEEAKVDSQLELRKNITLFRSDAVQEIVSSNPGFFERWALVLFIFILVSVFMGTWFIKYPDVIRANASLTAANAPKEIVSRQDGKLIKLFVTNDDSVSEGQTIAWIESTADHKEVITLSNLLNKANEFLSNNDVEKVSSIFKDRLGNLGELQPSYQEFISAWQQFNDYLVNGYYNERKKILFRSSVFLQKMHQNLEQQMVLTRQDLDLSQETYDTINSLYNYKVISTQDLRDQKSKLISKQLTVPQLESSILSNENLQVDKQKEIAEMEHNISQQEIIFQEAIQTLESLTDEWLKKYIIKSPASGKVSFIIPLQENQFVSSGKIVGFVNPSDIRYYALVNLSQTNFGEIDTGEKVQLRFDAYPFQEFGFVYGKLTYISKVPSDSGFLANVILPEGLKTNYKKVIQYRSGLKSQAWIITQDQRLLERFYNNIIKGIHEK